MSAALIIDILLWGSVAAVGFIALQRGRLVLTTSLREGAMDFINIVPRIAHGVIGSGYIAAVIPQEIITGWLARIAAGSASSLPSSRAQRRREGRWSAFRSARWR